MACHANHRAITMELTWLAWSGMLLLGCFLGLLGGLFGIGGGIIAIPMLVLVIGLEQQTAQGTALVMMVPNLLVAFWRYQQRHPLPFSLVLQLGGVAAATTWLAAQVATRLDSFMLRLLFGVFLFWLAFYLIRRQRKQAGQPGRSLPEKYLPLVGMIGGTSSGLLGIGGGLVANPFFTGWFGQSQTRAQCLSLALVMPASLVALGVYTQAGQVDWRLGGALALGGLLTVSAGVALAHRWKEKHLQRAFALLMLLTALWMILDPLLTGLSLIRR